MVLIDSTAGLSRAKNFHFGVAPVYTGVDNEGKGWEKIKSWFGFRVHLVVEAHAELPVSYTVTKAFIGEQPVMRELLNELNEKHPELMRSLVKTA